MLRTVVVDHDKRSRERLVNLLADYCPQIEVIAKCNSLCEAEDAIYKHKPDFIFLDIEMPGTAGFEILMQQKEISFEIIFTTPGEQYTDHALRFSTLDFLPKPIIAENLTESVRQAGHKIARRHQQRQIGALFHSVNYFNTNKKITLPTLAGLEFVAIGNIIRCESDNTYTIFHLTDKTKMVVSKSIGDYEELLMDYHFFRIHQSHLINLRFVKSYKRGNGAVIIMEDNSVVEVSRRKKEQLVARLSLI